MLEATGNFAENLELRLVHVGLCALERLDVSVDEPADHNVEKNDESHTQCTKLEVC